MNVKNRHLLHYIPHGINSTVFKPLETTNSALNKFRKNIFKTKEYDFMFFYNSRNINRKRTANIMLAFRTFCDNLPKEKADKCILVLHTEKVLDAGTDLNACGEAFLKGINYLVLENRYSPEEMNLLYNMADVTINVSSNEGFGLSVAESIMSGTPVIVNVTGGLQDQIGQLDDEGNPVEFSRDFGSNNVKKFTRHGIWAKPIWPVTRVIQGSPPTPYIFDDLCKWEDVADAMMYWYDAGKQKCIECGAVGREWALGSGGLNHTNLAAQFIKAMDFTLENFTPRSRFSLHRDTEHVGHKMPDNSMGFEIPKIDVGRIQKELKECKIT
jgi:glycosyltransferase involved in cell wall biosynthesis